MKKVFGFITLGVLLVGTLSCKGSLKKGIGIRGTWCKEDMIILNEDTFKVQERIGDSLLIVYCYPEDYESCFLIKRESNGYYYVLQEGISISSIENTQDFALIDDRTIYNVRNNGTFTLPWNASYLYYLGMCKDKAVFTEQDSIYFSDGRCVALRDDSYCKRSDKEGEVVLVKGVRKLSVSLETLYHFKNTAPVSDPSIYRFIGHYGTTSKRENEDEFFGLNVSLDIPVGDTNSDKAIRKWMTSAIKDDAFSMFGCPIDVFEGNSSTLQEMKLTLEQYGTLWEQLYRSYGGEEESYTFRIYCDVSVRKVVDCKDYTTYYYASSLYEGGLHDLPRSYYITYDKRLKKILTASDALKKSKLRLFRNEALKSIHQEYDEKSGRESDWKDFTRSVFSFHSPMVYLSGVDENMLALLEHDYMCDEWSGWGYPTDKAFTLDNFPLPHLAVLPEGIVLTYHPYQIDCFASGEYHIVIPFDRVESCLQYGYHHDKKDLPKLEQFIK